MGEECQQRKQTKTQVMQRFLSYLRNRGDVQVDSEELVSGLAHHFRLLPTRYALDVMTESLDILNHFNLLREARSDGGAVFFHVRPVEVLLNAAYATKTQQYTPLVVDSSPEPRSQTLNTPIPIPGPSSSQQLSKLPRPAFGSSPGLQLLGMEMGVNDADDSLGIETYIPAWFWEVTVASMDQPKLLSKLTDALGDVGLSIREAHVFNTADGMVLDVFVTEGWSIEAKEGLEQTLGERFSNLSPPPPMPSISEGVLDPLPTLQSSPSTTMGDWDIDVKQLSIESRIGQGQFGTLYKGAYCGQSVAIKILRDVNASPQQYQEFVQEVSIMRKVRHKNVVQFIGACTQKPNLCILFEFMSGGSLYDHLKQNGPLNYKQVIKVALDVSYGMDYLHKMGIIHRDLKAANILLDENFVIKIGDFGIARVLSNDGIMTAETGTYRWMAPEVVEHSPYGLKADVFSFGLVLWELMTGRIPYEGMTPLQAAVGVVQNGMRPPIPTNTPEQLSSLIQACWQQKPDKRPSFSQLWKVLEQMYKQAQEEEMKESGTSMAKRTGLLGFRRRPSRG
eukprot:TRINITY_DN3859_c0_g1_i21.p1 TRINITY_DN3859_c0_g1~~TRINITY_DN3859_c0_g1_i21.p1  ORF type:complete len:563 (-),score=66.47 TRINITY_DN3859_c0_g1_i21:1776-3464(-)